MANWKRREFINTAGVGILAASTGLLPRDAQAAWGDLPPALPSFGDWPTPTIPQFKILEVFLYGGLSPWETFFHRPGLVDPWYGQQGDLQALPWGCANSPSPVLETKSIEGDVALGPLTKPIWADHIANRMRVVVMQHGLEPHEAAIPYSITGHVLGRPNFSSLGAAVSHRYRDLSVPTPIAYAMMPTGLPFGGDNFQAIDATGSHGGEHRPLRLMVGTGSDEFVSQLARPGMGASNRDQVLDYYRSHYRDHLRWQNDPAPSAMARSKGFGGYDASTNTLLNASGLDTLLSGGTVPLSVGTTNECPEGSLSNSREAKTATSIAAAAKLLTLDPAMGGARHCCVVDGGVRLASGGATYDTHSSDNITATARNLWETLSALSNVIQDPDLPADPNKINLDDTLVVLKTEFGRTPNLSNPGNSGRDHWPQGYVNVLIGGPVEAAGGAKVIGAMDAGGVAISNQFYTPSELQAALMIAAGIYPFEPENFGVGDMGEKTKRANEQETANQLWRQVLLGQGA